ncbi:MAG: hypothetical protein DRJ03_27980, partial [Chloroflexi bacterium]
MKNDAPTKIPAAALLTLTIPAIALAAAASKPMVLFGPGWPFDLDTVVTVDSRATLSKAGALRIETGHTRPWPGITLKAPDGKWDLSAYNRLCLDVKNLGTEPLTLSCRLDSPHANATSNRVTGRIALAPGAAGTLTVQIFPAPW